MTKHLRPSARPHNATEITEPVNDETVPAETMTNATQLQPYPRVELTPEELNETRDGTVRLLQKNGLRTMVFLFGELAVENQRLVKECNEHRAARGFEPIKVYKA